MPTPEERGDWDEIRSVGMNAYSVCVCTHRISIEKVTGVCIRECGMLSRSRADSATPWTIARQAPLSMGSPRQESWSELPLPSPGDLPDPGVEPTSPAWQAGSIPLSHQGTSYVDTGM